MLGGYREAKKKPSSPKERANRKAGSAKEEAAKEEATKEDIAVLEVRRLYVQVHIAVSRLPYEPGMDKWC